MKRLICCLILMVSIATAYSQKVYFIYIQADLEQPFSVRLNEKVYHSSSSGYLILSKLRDSTYPVTIIFPQNKWPEQSFTIEVRSKDKGFLLKNFGDKGWGLYDLQTSSVQMSSTNGSANTPKAEVQQVSAFTEVLSKAANDPSLREKPVTVKKEEPVTATQAVVREEVKKTENTEPVVVKKDEPPAVKEVVEAKKEEEKQPDPVVATPQEYKPSVVKRKSESSTSEGLGLSFIDEYPDGKKDTINILIPNPPRRTKTEQPKQDKKFLDITAETKDVTPEVKSADPDSNRQKKEEKKPSTCSANATDNDFIKLRRKMVGESNDDDMVSEAAKYFKSKCFTVAQVKNLSNLFLNDAGKYKFFDAAYNHVSDPDNFSSLQTELKDEYYLNRFKAMVR